MKLFIIVILLFFNMNSFAGEQKSYCGEKSSSKVKIVSKVVSLPRPSTEGFFYMLAADQYYSGNHYVISMKPQDVLTELNANIADLNIDEDVELLQLLKNEMPITSNQDIVKYSINNTKLLPRTKFLTDALISKGKASIIDLWSSNPLGQALTEITLLDIDRHGQSREYCAPVDRSILRLTYTIED